MQVRPIDLAALLAAALLALPQGALADPRTLARDAGCAICHADRIRLAAPSWQEIAERYKGDAAAAETLFASTRLGTTPDAIKWGGAPKLGVDAETIGDDDLRAVIAWILGFAEPTP